MTEEPEGERTARQRAGRKARAVDGPHDEVDDTSRSTSSQDREEQDDAMNRLISDMIAEQDGQPLVDWDAMPPVDEWDDQTVVIYLPQAEAAPDEETP